VIESIPIVNHSVNSFESLRAYIGDKYKKPVPNIVDRNNIKSDIKLNCLDCNKQFDFFIRDQKHYASQNYVYPVRCRKCRPIRSAMCHSFQNGSCHRGSSCRFSHESDINENVRRWNGIHFKLYGGAQVCYSYTKGKCNMGNRCRSLHHGRPVLLGCTTNHVDSTFGSVHGNLWPGGDISTIKCKKSDTEGWIGGDGKWSEVTKKGWTGGEGDWSDN
jgi:hypothetical protein